MANQIALSLKQPKITIDLSSSVVVKEGNLPYYTGDYTVTPDVDAQTLSTKGYSMANDLTVGAIPYYEVGNERGGNTVIIGG